MVKKVEIDERARRIRRLNQEISSWKHTGLSTNDIIVFTHSLTNDELLDLVDHSGLR